MMLATCTATLSSLTLQTHQQPSYPPELRPFATLMQQIGFRVERGEWSRSTDGKSITMGMRIRPIVSPRMSLWVSIRSCKPHGMELYNSLVPDMQGPVTAESKDEITHLPSRYPVGEEVIFMKGITPMIRWTLADCEGLIRGGGVGQPKVDPYRLMERVAREAVNYWLVNSPAGAPQPLARRKLQAFGRPAHLLLSSSATAKKGDDGIWRLSLHGRRVVLPMGAAVAYVDGQPIPLTHPIVEQNGEPLVPLEVTRS